MPLVLDIETVGQSVDDIPERALDYLFASIAKDEPDPEELERRREDLISRFSLDPATGRIIVIGLYDIGRNAERTFVDNDEKALLSEFWDWLRGNVPETLVTFNGKRFDVPYIHIRSAVHGLDPGVRLPNEPGTFDRHFDVREALEGNERRRRGSLDFFTATFGVPSPKTELDGTLVGEAFKNGRIDDIVRYCLDDCRATAAIYERLAPFYE